jgi:hypothetical protein
VPDPEDGLAVPGRWMLMTSTDLIFILILFQFLVVGQNSFFFFGGLSLLIIVMFTSGFDDIGWQRY